MDFSIAGEQLPISSFFTQRSSSRSQMNKRRADQGDKTKSAPSKRSKNKGPLSDSAGTSMATSKEIGDSRARSKPTKANATTKPVDDVFRDHNEGIQASRPKDPGNYEGGALTRRAADGIGLCLTPLDKGRRYIDDAATLPTPPPSGAPSRIHRILSREQSLTTASADDSRQTMRSDSPSSSQGGPSELVAGSTPSSLTGPCPPPKLATLHLYKHPTSIDRRTDVLNSSDDNGIQPQNKTVRVAHHPSEELFIPSSQSQEVALAPSFHYGNEPRHPPKLWSQDVYVPSSQSQEESAFKLPGSPHSSPRVGDHNREEIIPSSQSQEHELMMSGESTRGRVKSSSSSLIPTSQYDEVELRMPGPSQQSGDLWVISMDRPTNNPPRSGVLVESPQPISSSCDGSKNLTNSGQRVKVSASENTTSSQPDTGGESQADPNANEGTANINSATAKCHVDDRGSMEPSSPLTPLTSSSSSPSSPKRTSSVRSSLASMPPPSPPISSASETLRNPDDRQFMDSPPSQAVEAFQGIPDHGISQRSCTPSQVRMFRDMFDEEPDWLMDEDYRRLGSQVDPESVAQRLPTGTQSQADVYMSHETEDFQRTRVAQARHNESGGNGGFEMECAGGISFNSDGSSIPQVVDDFLALFSQPGTNGDEG